MRPAGPPRARRRLVSEPIYLDCLASTRVDPEVLEAMLPWFGERMGNASSSTHSYGWQAADAVERAREQVAELIGADRGAEIVFTSGATESNNTVIQGVAQSAFGLGAHVIASSIEHPSVLSPCAAIDPRVISVTLVKPTPDGLIEPERVADALTPDTSLITVMVANNEIGTLQPVADIANIARGAEVLIHVDAAQALGKMEIDVQRLGVDLLSLSAHKFSGPQGIGALYVRGETPTTGLPALLHGGGQQQGRRGGTIPVALAVGLGAAASLAMARWREDARRMTHLGSRLLDRLHAEVPDICVNCAKAARLPGCLNFSIPGVLADSLIAATPGLAFSSGSACSSHHGGGSHVLAALGLSQSQRDGSVRVGIGRENTAQEIDTAADLLIGAVRRLRSEAG